MKVGYASEVPISDEPLPFQRPADFSLLEQGIGLAVEGIAGAVRSYEQEQKRAQRFKALTDFSNYQTQLSDHQAELMRNSTPGSTALPAQYDKMVDTTSAPFLKDVPDHLRPEMEYRVNQLRQGGHASIRDFQYRQNDEFSKTGLAQERLKAIEAIHRNPTPENLAAQEARLKTLNEASTLTQLDKQEEDLKSQAATQETGLYYATKNPQQWGYGGPDLPLVTSTQPGRVSAGSAQGLQPQLVAKFKATQNAFGKSLPIVSGRRSEATNAAAGGARHSEHLQGAAVDIDIRGMPLSERVRLIQTASANGITGIGVYQNSLHLDVGPRRAWGPTHSYTSMPGWAKPVIDQHLTGDVKPAPRSAERLFNVIETVGERSGAGDISPKGAAGVMQVMPDTARDVAKKLRDPNFPTTTTDIQKYLATPEVGRKYGQIYAGMMLERYNGDWEAAVIAYNGGMKRADAWIKSGRNDSVLPAETQAYIARVRTAMEGAGGPGVQTALENNDPRFAMVSPDKREAIDRSVSQDTRVLLSQAVPDSLAAANAGQAYSGQAPTQQQFHQAYPDDGEARWQNYQTSLTGAQSAALYKSMPDAAIYDDLQASAVTGGEGSAAQEDALNAKQTAAQQELTARHKQGADYVYNSNRDVQESWKQFNILDPKTGYAAVSKSLDAQAQLGLGRLEQKPLPSAIVAKAANYYKDPSKLPNDRADAFIQMVTMTTDPIQQKLILGQLTEKGQGLPPALEAAGEAAIDGDGARARRLFDVAFSKPDQLDTGKHGTELTAFNTEMEDALYAKFDKPGSLGYKYYGLDYGGSVNFERVHDDKELAKTDALRYLKEQPSLSTQQAVDLATHDLMGDVTPHEGALSNGRGTYDLLLAPEYQPYAEPTGQNTILGIPTGPAQGASTLQRGLEMIRPEVEVSQAAQLDQIYKGDQQEPVISQSERQLRLDTIMENGTFRNITKDKIGFFFSGKFLTNSDGSPLMWDLHDVVRRAQPSVTLRPFEPGKDQPRQNPDGSVSTEITRTVETAEGWANVPSLWYGDQGPQDLGQQNDDQLSQIAQQYEKKSGKKFPRYKTLDEAEKAAQERSKAGGATNKSLAY